MNDINRLNVFVKMIYHTLINIILNGLTTQLRQAIAHYEDLLPDSSKWKEKPLYMDITTTEFQTREIDYQSKRQWKKRTLK